MHGRHRRGDEDRRWGGQSRIAKGLASMANTPGNDSAIGPHGIIVVGRDKVRITNGGPTEPLDAAWRDDLARHAGGAEPRRQPARQGPADHPAGQCSSRADIWDFVHLVNPDAAKGNPLIDSNPVDLLLDGSRLVVADAGGNAIDTVEPVA